MHRETVASTIRVAPASWKSSSGGSCGSSNPTSIHPKAKSMYMKKEIHKEDRMCGCQKCQRNSFETRISKCVTNVVRHHDQDERETDGAMHWDEKLPVLKGRFKNQLEREITDEDCSFVFILEASRQGLNSVKMKWRNATYSCDPGSFSWSDHLSKTDELRDVIPYRWKQFIFHVGRARDQYSIAEVGLVAGGKERKEGRQTIFFTPLDPFNSDADEAVNG